MLVACRPAGLSALETYYAGVRARGQYAAGGWPRTGLYWIERLPAAARGAGGIGAMTC